MRNKEEKAKGALHYYLQSTSGIVGAVLVLVMIIVAICSIFGITPYDPVEQHIENILQGPSSHFWFGICDHRSFRLRARVSCDDCGKLPGRTGENGPSGNSNCFLRAFGLYDFRPGYSAFFRYFDSRPSDFRGADPAFYRI